jgi:hypothetical protein
MLDAGYGAPAQTVEIDVPSAVKIDLKDGAVFAIAGALRVREDDIGRVRGVMRARGYRQTSNSESEKADLAKQHKTPPLLNRRR